MPTKIYHKDHGIVITNSPDEINAILAKGGKIIKKASEAYKTEQVPVAAKPQPKGR